MQFINGVKLLATKEITEEKFGWNFGSISFAILSIVCMIIAITFAIIFESAWFFLILGSLFSAISAIVLGQKYIPTGKFRYQICVDDGVDFVEFTKLYNIVARDEEIFTIELRDAKETK